MIEFTRHSEQEIIGELDIERELAFPPNNGTTPGRSGREFFANLKERYIKEISEMELKQLQNVLILSPRTVPYSAPIMLTNNLYNTTLYPSA